MKTQLTVSASAATDRLLGPLLGRGVASIPKKGCAAFSRVALILLAALSLGQAQTPPDLITYNFAVAETKTLPGTSATPGPPCNGTIAAADQIQSLALVALFYQNACYTDGRYNHNNYLVERGTVTATSGGASFAAYRIHEPQNKATQFLASQHALYYRFPTIENYSVYVFAGGSLSKVAEVPAASIPNTTSFIPVPTVNPITVSTVVGSITYVFAPSSVRVSSYTLLAPGVEAARVASTPFGNVLKYRYTVAGLPFDSARDYTAGPGDFDNIYGTARRFFLVRNGNAGLGVVWQDQTSLALKLTWFGANRQSPTTVALANPQAHTLACAIGDDAGNVYYLTIQPGSGAPNTPRSATLTKAGPTGATIATAAVDTSATGLNLVEFFKGASMQYLSGKLAVIIGRIMTQSGDGLNHQGGIAAIYNATTLALDKNWGQTSGHSWESVLTTNTSGAFVGIDLGDNFPRGVHLHKFTTATRNSRVISGLKTAHGTTPQNPAGTTFPVYSEISGGGTTYYRWSNDNRTYTELGGLAQTALGYSASFVGERSPGGRLLDNSRVGGNLNDPRNVGFITVVENFQSASGSGSEVSNDLVVTPGTVETAGFYSFTGGWTPQRNAGVVWLTSYSTTAQNASRLKMTTRADGSLMLLWEVWTATSYVTTKGLTVGANGTIINAETDLGTHVRLGRRDDPLRFNNSIYLPAGSKADTAVELIVIEPATTGAPSVTTLAATVVTNTTATLNGSANPNGLAATGFFQWGTTTNYGQTTAAASLGSGTAAVALATPISGLTAGLTYHFRAVSSNSAGVVYGANLSFTTPNTAPVPTVTTLAATAVTKNSATLNGSANPNGSASSGWFQWGTTAGYGQTTPPVNLGNGTSAVALSSPLTWLTAGVTYHFRAVASNSTGVVYGNDMTFTPPVTFAPPISTFTGGDAGEGLDFQGTFPYAVNVGGNGAPGLIGNANFTIDSAPGVSITASAGTLTTLDTWAAPSFGATANDDRLEQAMRSIRYALVPAKLTVTLGNLLAGHSYKLQMLFIEQCCDRVFDVKVNGATVATAFRLLDFGPSGTPLAVTHTFTATGTSAVIELGGGTVPAGRDGTPTLSAFTLEDLAVLPSVTTLAATDVSYLGATLNGSANPNGTAAIGFFQWGSTVGLGQTTATVNLGSGTAALALSTPLSVIGGFIGVPFYFRAVVSNSVGVVYGEILAWATPASPNAATLAATAVSGSGATLNGSATPNGLAAISYFQWGTNGSYGQTTTPVNLGNGYAAIALAAPISGLTAGLTYHFRAVLSNSANLVVGANLTFTTPGGTSVVIVQSSTNAAACVGGTATFAVTATGATGYQWQRRSPGEGSFANLGGATAANYTTPALTAADDGAAYRVIASAPGASATSGEALLAVISLGTPAVTYNFNAGLPAGTAVYGNAYVDAGTGVLELNPNAGGQNGAFLTADLAPGRAVGGFAATFRARLQQGSSPPADGFSFNWATDLPASIYAMGEEGAGSGLRVAFDTYNNADGEAPAIDVWWNTNLIARRSVSIPFLVRGADFFDVQIRLTTGGLLDLTYGCESIFARLPIPGYVPQTGARFGLGSRTGGLWETHSIDDLALELYSANPNTLTITRSGANVVVSWPPAVRGVLQQSPSVAPTTWSYAPSGATNPIALTAPGAARFYRLIISPTNDLFAGRTLLTGTPLTGTASNAGATKEAGEPAHANNPGGRSLWWFWTAPSNGTVTFTLAGSSFDTTLGVYTGTTVNGLTLVAANDDYDGNLFSRVTFTATQNVTYQIAVDGYDSGGGAGAGTVQWNLTMP